MKQDQQIANVSKDTKQLGDAIAAQISAPPKTSKSIVAKFMYVALAVAAGGILLGLYWYLQNPTPFTLNKYPVPIKNEPVYTDGVAKLEFDYCKHIDVRNGIIERSFVSSKTEIDNPDVIDPTSKGCYKLEAVVPVPPQARPDTYYIQYRVTYKINPLKTVTQEFRSQNFKVIER